MSIGTIQAEERGSRVTQKELAEHINLSRSMVAEIEAGRRKLPRDVAPRAVKTLDSGFYAMEVAAEMTGGSWVTKLNNVDLHRSAVKEKSLEELEEATQWIRKTSIANKSNTSEEIKKVLLESIDAIVALSHFVAVVCKEYSVSWVGIWREHRQKLKERGYLKGE
jgi:transcriptional regulator with XRE-family HTH domain